MIEKAEMTDTPIKIHHTYSSVVIGAAFTLAIAVVIFGACAWQHQAVSDLASAVGQKQRSIVDLQRQLTDIQNANNGIVTASPASTNSQVSLVNGQVIFAMPSGWELATATRFARQCYIGGLADQFCLDTATIVPKTLDNNSSTSTYGGINIAVYKHSDNTSAANWFANDFGSAGEYQSTGNQTSNLTIDGHDALYINSANATLVYGDQFNDEFYIIVNKSYVVRIDSNVNNNAGPNGTTKLNDNSQYSPIVKSFAESLKMQGN